MPTLLFILAIHIGRLWAFYSLRGVIIGMFGGSNYILFSVFAEFEFRNYYLSKLHTFRPSDLQPIRLLVELIS